MHASAHIVRNKVIAVIVYSCFTPMLRRSPPLLFPEPPWQPPRPEGSTRDETRQRRPNTRDWVEAGSNASTPTRRPNTCDWLVHLRRGNGLGLGPSLRTRHGGSNGRRSDRRRLGRSFFAGRLAGVGTSALRKLSDRSGDLLLALTNNPSSVWSRS